MCGETQFPAALPSVSFYNAAWQHLLPLWGTCDMRASKADPPVSPMQEPTVQFKSCRRCGIVKPSTDFYKNKTNQDGLYNNCKACFGCEPALCAAPLVWDAKPAPWRARAHSVNLVMQNRAVLADSHVDRLYLTEEPLVTVKRCQLQAHIADSGAATDSTPPKA